MCKMDNDSFQAIVAEFDKEFAAEIPEKGEAGASVKSSSSKSHSILVSPKQRGNPLLKSIRNVPWEFDGTIVPDYQMGPSTCALFLSLKYHNLNPDYIHDRLKLLAKSYDLRVLLVQVDIPDPQHVLKNLTRICILADLTLILAWSADEAGQIIETYKIYENKPADILREKGEASTHLQLVQVLTSVRSINKTDAMTLLARFKTLEGVIKASEAQLSECPGLGPSKAKKLFKVIRENFCRT